MSTVLDTLFYEVRSFAQLTKGLTAAKGAELRDRVTGAVRAANIEALRLLEAETVHAPTTVKSAIRAALKGLPEPLLFHFTVEKVKALRPGTTRQQVSVALSQMKKDGEIIQGGTFKNHVYSLTETGHVTSAPTKTKRPAKRAKKSASDPGGAE